MIPIKQLKSEVQNYLDALIRFEQCCNRLRDLIKEKRAETKEGEIDEELYELLQLYMEYTELWSELDDLVEFNIREQAKKIRELTNRRIQLK